MPLTYPHDSWAANAALDAEIAAGRVADTGEFFYRPGEIVVSDRAAQIIGGPGAVPGADDATDSAPWLRTLGLQLWRLDAGIDVTDEVRRLKDLAYAGVDPAVDPDPVAEPDQEVVRVSLNHVLVGAPHGRIGTPHGAPSPAPERPFDPPPLHELPDLAVLDTGLVEPDLLRLWHPELLAATVRSGVNVQLPGDIDHIHPVAGSDELAHEAGHGTFIAGVVRHVAPDLVVRVRAVLEPSGFGDDVHIAAGVLAVAAVPVLSMSFAGATFDDLSTPCLAAAIASLPASVIAVAAAGNNADDSRPYWPAAFPGVVAVAAVEEDPTRGVVPAPYSNTGPVAPASPVAPWVDACTWGSDVIGPYVAGDYPTGPGAGDVTRFTDDHPFARWSGTSFATPVVAAAIAQQVRALKGPAAVPVAAADAWEQVRQGLTAVPGHPEVGLLHLPARDPRR